MFYRLNVRVYKALIPALYSINRSVFAIPSKLCVFVFFQHADLRILVTEWLDGILLENFIRLFYHRCLPEGIARVYCRQMVSAIIAMQRKRILLRFVKSLVLHS